MSSQVQVATYHYLPPQKKTLKMRGTKRLQQGWTRQDHGDHLAHGQHQGA